MENYSHSLASELRQTSPTDSPPPVPQQRETCRAASPSQGLAHKAKGRLSGITWVIHCWFVHQQGKQWKRPVVSLPMSTLHGSVLGGNLLAVSVLSLCNRTLSWVRTGWTRHNWGEKHHEKRSNGGKGHRGISWATEDVGLEQEMHVCIVTIRVKEFVSWCQLPSITAAHHSLAQPQDEPRRSSTAFALQGSVIPCHVEAVQGAGCHGLISELSSSWGVVLCLGETQRKDQKSSLLVVLHRDRCFLPLLMLVWILLWHVLSPQNSFLCMCSAASYLLEWGMDAPYSQCSGCRHLDEPRHWHLLTLPAPQQRWLCLNSQRWRMHLCKSVMCLY